ncbi:hypothetical protein VitviT2T_001231 [Vitis vinifera]|uniref:Tubby C-terminal domain-containing protein n=2 Tax=Vitis vinifera TaxID=29760 RepID=A0ABY9BGC3_VITVI|nr:hypothetical protein VitviT2T_001231 [Vitis vinifera]
MGAHDVLASEGAVFNWMCSENDNILISKIENHFRVQIIDSRPRGSLIQCYIKWNRTNQTYHLYLGLIQASTNDGKFLLAAWNCRRPTCTDDIISLNDDDVWKGSTTYIGKLRSNFRGTKFTVYDAHATSKCRSKD